MKVLLIISLVNLLIAIIFWGLWRITNSKLKAVQHNVDAIVDTNHALMKELENARFQLKIKSDNRKEADEKINALHTGDAVDNAINGLSNN